MKKTPEELRAEGQDLIAEGRAKIAAAQKDEEASSDISPHTKLPVEHPESQAVERERHRIGISLASAMKPEDIQKFLDEHDEQ